MTISTSFVVLPRFRAELRMFAVIAAAGLAVGGAHAQGAAPGKACDPAPAKAVSVQGTVESKRAADAQWQPVKLNDTFCAGDSIRVQAKSRADVMLLNQSIMRLNANSTITVAAPKDQTTGVVDLVRGATNILSRGPRSLEVNTPFTVAGVRGTEFLHQPRNRPDADHGVRGRGPRPECGGEPLAHRRPVRGGPVGQGPGPAHGRAAARRRPVGAVLPAGRVFPPRRIPRRRRLAGHGPQLLGVLRQGRPRGRLQESRERPGRHPRAAVLRLPGAAGARRRTRRRRGRRHRPRAAARAERCECVEPAGGHRHRPERQGPGVRDRPEECRGQPELGHGADRAVLRAAGALRPAGRAGERREGGRARSAGMRWRLPGSPN